MINNLNRIFKHKLFFKEKNHLCVNESNTKKPHLVILVAKAALFSDTAHYPHIHYRTIIIETSRALRMVTKII